MMTVAEQDATNSADAISSDIHVAVEHIQAKNRLADPAASAKRVVELAAEMARWSDVLLEASVRVMRERGATWAAVGEALGVTRQAAQMRFGKSSDETGW